MNTLRIAQAALATILAVGINANSYAFMAVPAEESADVQVDLTEMVNSLQEEINAGETSCEDMLAKLDAVLKDINAKLDAGVPNEAEYVEARDAVAKMRYNLECLAKDLTLDNGVAFAPMAAPIAAPMAPLAGPVSGGCSTCGGGGGGGMVAGGGGGGGGGGGLVFLAGAGLFATAVAINDDNNGFGVIASVSD